MQPPRPQYFNLQNAYSSSRSTLRIFRAEAARQWQDATAACAASSSSSAALWTPRCAVEVQAHVVWLYLRFTLSYRIGRKRFFRKLCENAPRGRGTDGGEQLQYPETGNRVARVLCPAQDRQHVRTHSGFTTGCRSRALAGLMPRHRRSAQHEYCVARADRACARLVSAAARSPLRLSCCPSRRPRPARADRLRLYQSRAFPDRTDP